MTFSQKKLTIRFHETISCTLWGAYWGPLQDIIRKRQCNNEEITYIICNMEECEWADPFPLMSITMELYNFNKGDKRNARVDVIISNLKGENSYAKGTFRKFMATQGFLESLLKYAITVKCGSRIISPIDVKKFSSQRYTLLLENADILKMQLFELTSNNEMNCIETIVTSTMERLKNTLSLAMHDLIEMQIYHIVAELVMNVNQHAYTQNENKIFSVYIRKRTNYDKQAYKKEEKNCPALKNDILVNEHSIIELFFGDIGMGIANSFSISNKKTNSHYPLRSLLFKILKDGERNTISSKSSAYGGLYFVARILQECKGYVWCKEANEWVGALSNDIISGKSNNIYIKTDLENYDKQYIKGLFWGLRIPYTDSIYNRKRIETVWNQEINNHPVFIAYKNGKESIQINDNILTIDERFDKPFCCLGDKKNIQQLTLNEASAYQNSNGTTIFKNIWFPKEGYTKNAILEHLHLYNQVFLRERQYTLYIGDINPQEVLCYYYALIEMNLNIKKLNSIKKIVLITKCWGILVFENKENILIESTQEASDFLSNRITQSSNEFRGITEYALFLRKYDSRIFWASLSSTQDANIFINAKIEWETGKTINGYINFEQIYRHPKIYTLIKNALYRTKGFVNNALIEYRNMEIITKRVCDGINKELFLFRNSVFYRIYVGGICVTGYTKDSYYRESDKDMIVAFFQHINSEKQFKDIAFLLLWADSDLLNTFNIDHKTYIRLGKTNLITLDKNETLINTSNLYENVETSKQNMYKELSKKYPKFIKYGHYKTDNHHYLIGFDMQTYIENSYTRRQGIICAISAFIIFYLTKTEQESFSLIRKITDKIFQAKVKECLIKNLTSYSDKGDLLLYHSNSTMDCLMNLITKILPTELQKKIFPVAIADIQQRGTPTALAPLDTYFLKKRISETNGRLLYMDSTLYSGRNMLEIENTLYNLGCKKVKFYSLIDFRRLRYTDEKCRSYWKVNIPRLGAESNCVICQGLKVVEDHISKVDSRGKERLQQWKENWQCISINNSLNNHGIENNYEYNFIDNFPFEIKGSLCLSIYMAEKLCETYHNDYVYKEVIKEKYPPEINIQLICTQILLFGRQNSRRLQTTLIGILLKNMATIATANCYTGLAAITLLLQDKKLLFDVINQILHDNNNSQKKAILEIILNSENEDLVLVLGYFIKNSIEIDDTISSYHRLTDQYDIFKKAYERLLPEKELKLISKEFQGLYKNEQKSMRHSSGIYKLLNEHVPTTQPDDYVAKCNKALTEIETLCELARHFPIFLMNDCSEDKPNYKKLYESVNQVKMQISGEIINTKNQVNNNNGQICCSESLKEAINKCIIELDKYLKAYYIASNSTGDKYFENIIKDTAKKYFKKIKIKVSKESENKWYYWNDAIGKEFTYLLENCMHCERKENLKTLGYNNANDESLYHMFIDINFGMDLLKITFSSWSEKSATMVKHKFQHDNRLSKEYAAGFDVVFDFTDEKEEGENMFLLKSIIAIPACYQTLKGGIDNE